MMMLSTTLALTLLICFEASFSFIQAQNNKSLPASELHTLRLIANDVGKKDWNFTENPCNPNSSWNVPQTTASNIPDWYINGVTCDCESRGPCHITGIYLQGQDLVGVLPRSLSNLTKLAYISLSGNYLRGTIPSEWASMQLTSLFIDLNLLSGPIPGFLGNITTLSYMNLHHNQFTGKLPAELGKLAKLQWLDVYDNYLMGNLPYQLSNLTMLKRLMISSNNFTGKLPNFQSWSYLEMLEIQGTGLQGPLPASIFALTRLNSLIISDLNGGGASQLPDLRSLTNLLKLVLRSCYISGPIPEYWSITLPNLEYLDLSFNNIQGEIPDLDILPLQFMYLTSNSLTGPIPDWIKDNSYRSTLILN